MKLTRLKFAVIIFIIASVISGGSVYLFSDNYVSKVKYDLQNKASDLDSEVRLLKSEIEVKSMEMSKQKDEYKSQIDKLQNDIKALTNNNKTDLNKRISELNIENDSLRQKLNELQQTVSTLKRNDGAKLKEVIAPRANEVLTAIKNKDMKKLSAMVHPAKGVRFSPYAYVDIKKNLVFSSAQIEKMPNDSAKYMWGYHDGSGLPINMTFKEYNERFVYNKDFLGTDKIGYNQFMGGGNTINNAFEAYPNAFIVEYYLAGTNPSYGGLDWGSIRLVFEESGSVWYLVGIIHDEWTI